jgi:hypothetical protein
VSGEYDRADDYYASQRDDGPEYPAKKQEDDSSDKMWPHLNVGHLWGAGCTPPESPITEVEF